MLSFNLYNINGNEYSINTPISYEMSVDIDAPCDGLRLTFIKNDDYGELYAVKVYDDSELIFNGYVDTQRDQSDRNGITTFIYARSSACILVDNEAEPRSYNSPSLLSLYELYAKNFGFKSALPDISCTAGYMVGKGVSCFDAINMLANGISGRNIKVDTDNRLVIPDGKQTVVIDTDSIASEKRIINRADAISVIDYKINGDMQYSCHLKSRFAEERGIMRSRKINVSAYPEWQQEYVLKNLMRRACDSYNCMELVLDGSHMLPLYADIRYSGKGHGDTDGYYISSCRIICDEKGERTIIRLNKEIDLKEISYVAE